MNPTLDRWLDAVKVAVIVVGVSWAWWSATADPLVVAGAAVGGLAIAWALSPLSLVGRHTPHAQALADATADDVVVYWRPGCTVAVALLRSLSREERDAATWVNVVRDPEAAAFVRSHRDGDMVTPTAVDGTGTQVPATTEAAVPATVSATSEPTSARRPQRSATAVRSGSTT